jgi:hypothetical protein
VSEYKARGAQFVREVCADVSGSHLEALSGITKLMAQVNLDDFNDEDFEPVEDSRTIDQDV